MKDAQFVSELVLVTIEKKMHGFDQKLLDDAYAKYDDIEEDDVLAIGEEAAVQELKDAKDFLLLANANGVVKRAGVSFYNFYTIWAAVCLHRSAIGTAENFSNKLNEFFALVDIASNAEKCGPYEAKNPGSFKFEMAKDYYQGAVGPTTDLAPREIRLAALLEFVVLP
jgi:hypothetical protein